MWGALIFDAIALPVVICCIWGSLATGRIFFRPSERISREDQPEQFWAYIALLALWSVAMLYLTLPAIFGGSD